MDTPNYPSLLANGYKNFWSTLGKVLLFRFFFFLFSLFRFFSLSLPQAPLPSPVPRLSIPFYPEDPFICTYPFPPFNPLRVTCHRHIQSTPISTPLLLYSSSPLYQNEVVYYIRRYRIPAARHSGVCRHAPDQQPNRRHSLEDRCAQLRRLDRKLCLDGQ